MLRAMDEARVRVRRVLGLGVAVALGVGVAGCGSGGGKQESAFTLRGTVTLKSGSALLGSPQERDCSGSGVSGFEDVVAGASVTVYDAAGAVVATGSLGAGKYPTDAYLSDPCVFPLVVPDVPGGAKFYQVEVSHWGKVTVSAEDAKARRFAASLR